MRSALSSSTTCRTIAVFRSTNHGFTLCRSDKNGPNMKAGWPVNMRDVRYGVRSLYSPWLHREVDFHGE